tara:strand:- start:221 stop:670 length:450 start_codon:yes stop_codon:yes gene_type:complete
MENENTEYINGDGDDFTIFLFSSKPKESNSIKLEISKPSNGIHFGLHLFQELLMIFTSGMKYLFSNDDGYIDVSILSETDIDLMNQYFRSIGFFIKVDKFSISEYLSNIKTPNFFINKELIEDNTPLHDFYYETHINGYIYRLIFNFLR